MMLDSKEIFRILSEIPDPEIPVINIAELGVLRDVQVTNEDVHVKITPTYSGCPAMRMIESDIISTLKAQGIEHIRVETVFSPAWTTDWLTASTKEKLRIYGIAPPEKIGVKQKPVCPRCGSQDTELVSQFGSTACKSLHRCKACLEPFDHFKCI